MITNPKDRITPSQAALFVANFIMATGILTLPRGAVDAVGTADAWISVIIGGVIALAAGYVIAKLGQLFPDQTFYQYSQTVVGKYPGTMLNLIVILYYVLLAGYVVRILGEVVHMYGLDSTPLEVVILAFMCVASYLTIGGINPIARLCELFAFPIFSILLLTLFLSLQQFELDNVRPVLAEGVMPLFKGIHVTALPFMGFEAMLILVSFMKEPDKAVRSVLTGIGIVIPFYVLIVLFAVGIFTVEEVKTLTWPTMSMAKAIEFPGAFFERFDSFLVIVWIMAIYTTFVPCHFLASLGLAQILKKNNHYFIYGILPAIYIAAMYPTDLNMVFKMGEYLGYLGAVIAAPMPVGIWVIAKIRRIGYGQS